MPIEYVVFLQTERVRRRVLPCLGHLNAIAYTRWQEFRQAALQARAVAVVMPELNSRGAQDLERMRAERPRLPIVLATALTPENLKRLNEIPALDDILLEQDLDDLEQHLREAADRSLLLGAAAEIREHPHLADDLAATLAAACRSPSPPRTVHALAEIFGASRQRLTTLWRGSVPKPGAPHDFIDWLLIAHLIARARNHESFAASARRVGVSPETARAALQRRFGVTALGEVARETILANLRHLLGSSKTLSEGRTQGTMSEDETRGPQSSRGG